MPTTDIYTEAQQIGDLPPGDFKGLLVHLQGVVGLIALELDVLQAQIDALKPPTAS